MTYSDISVIILLYSDRTEYSMVVSTGKEKTMQDEMNNAEITREETEAKMVYKFLLMIKESKDLEELEEKTRALLNK